MKILDMSSGSRSMWFNRLHPDTVYVDLRPSMKPTVVCDTKALPFPSDLFDLIVFDPPHVTCGKTSVMAQYYSSMEAEEIKDLISLSGKEAYRVSKDSGFLAFKWNDHDVKLERILRLMEGWEPLFGQRVAGRSKHRSGTYWTLLRKRFSLESTAAVVEFLREIDHE